MENKNNPQSQEAQTLHKRRVEKLKAELAQLNSRLDKLISIDVEDKNNSVEVDVRGKTTKLNYQKFNCFNKWLAPVLYGHNDIIIKNLEHLEKSRKSYSQFRKKFLNHLHSLKSSNKGHKGLNQYFEEEQVRELYNAIHNLQSLPSFLLTLEVFKSFTVCQILSHEKGQAFASNNFSSQGQRSVSQRVDVENFNKLFQSVKKSKSRVFSKQNLSYPEVDVIGNFLAKTFTSNRYNIILILGRNDFLPPLDDEIINFNDVTSHLEPVLNAILRRSSQDDKIANIIEVLENIDLPVSIKNRSDSFLFKNEAFENLKDSELKELKYLEKELFGKNILRLYFSHSGREDTDLYHFYRVSLLGELLNTLRHELSNPLFGLSLAADILHDDQMDEEVIQTVQDIKTNSERCQTIIKNFSNLYQDEDNFKKFDLVNLLKETIILTKSETKGIKKTVECEQDPYFLFSNPTWISQVVFNLVINAGQALFEYFPQERLRDSHIFIRVELDAGRTLIHISDNGPGIPESIQDKIFNAFVTTKDSGTGLGLAICKSLLNKLEGDIFFHNNNSHGTTFTVSLPLEPL